MSLRVVIYYSIHIKFSSPTLKASLSSLCDRVIGTVISPIYIAIL